MEEQVKALIEQGLSNEEITAQLSLTDLNFVESLRNPVEVAEQEVVADEPVEVDEEATGTDVSDEVVADEPTENNI